MSRHKQKLIVIVGPTASGKSELAVQLAKKFNGEIISADSRQVYRGLDIGTGKITTKEMQEIPHHLLDIANPKENFNVAHFKKQAEKAIRAITERRKIPILVGGTGFWIDAVVYDVVFPQVPPNPLLRRKLEKKTTQELLKMLKRLDQKRATTIDPQNPRRLIRAIEIARAIGKIPSIIKKSPYQALWIGIDPGPEALRKKIKTRLAARIKNGMISEARHLHKQGLSWKRFDELGLEYRSLARFLQKKITRQQFFKELYTAITHYAKRQRTWFKRNRSIHWITAVQTAENLTKKFLNE